VSKSDVVGVNLEYGLVPRVHLLPAEVVAQRKAKALRQRLLTILVGVIVLVGVAVGVVSFGLANATAEQVAEESRSAALLAQAAKYSSVTATQNQVDSINRLQPEVTTNEILWAKFIATVGATLPAGTSITDFTAKLDPPTADATSTDPLKGQHVATLSITALGPQQSISQWLFQLPLVQGVVDATPGAVVLSTDPGLYTVNVELLISKDVLANRFAAGK
jgi:hypothetical protein